MMTNTMRHVIARKSGIRLIFHRTGLVWVRADDRGWQQQIATETTERKERFR